MTLHSLLSYTITQYFVYVCVFVCVYRTTYRACIAVCRQKVPYYSNLAADEHSTHARNGNGDTRIIIIIYGSLFCGWRGGCPYTLGTLSKLLSILEKNRSPVYTFLPAIYVPRTSDGSGCTRCRKLAWYAYTYIRALLYICMHTLRIAIIRYIMYRRSFRRRYTTVCTRIITYPRGYIWNEDYTNPICI